ncbi:hypothetical protein FNV43_RR11143 [Rhamnella rubrinervis]|uniref:RNase H type-1 domain-containing protein n=1 Tax=Rhamnella rubrinervis TaxID=2594499 RepID=A0A8K0H509_9ROSA|nr:hypothetical protein FNV43_RR11143 [Rhamnella rubrinervis]
MVVATTRPVGGITYDAVSRLTDGHLGLVVATTTLPPIHFCIVLADLYKRVEGIVEGSLSNWLKANVGDHLKMEAAFAIVVRDEYGRVRFLASKLERVASASEAELKALVWALDLA